MSDVRRFIGASTGRLPIPRWPLAQSGQEFIRGFGLVRDRRRGGISAFPGEETYCDIRRALRFPTSREQTDLTRWATAETPRCAFRRLIADGRAVVRMELGLTTARQPCHLQLGAEKRIAASLP